MVKLSIYYTDILSHNDLGVKIENVILLQLLTKTSVEQQQC